MFAFFGLDPVHWLILLLCFGFVGVLIIAAVILIGLQSRNANQTGSRIKCPFCAEEIQESAIKCKHCGEFLKKEDGRPTQ